MGGPVTSPSRHSKVLIGLIEALGSALDLGVVLERAYPLLTQLVPADYGALGVSPSGRPSDYEWMVMKIPPAFFASYRDMAPHDFVRAKVAERANVVLRDDQMISRSELERNVMYRRAREVGSPIEHVMAVMLHIDQRWQSGLSLYRDRRCPFSVRESDALQRVTPAIVNAVRNCRMFASAADWGKALETAIGARGAAVSLVSLPGTIVEQTEGAARLLKTLFPRHEQRTGRLPDVLAAFVKRCATRPFESHEPMILPKAGGAALQVRFAMLPTGGSKGLGLLIFQEFSKPHFLPAHWQAVLTRREHEVVLAVLRGWDNRLIATELGCREATVKKHMQNVFDKLAVETRTALVARALQLNCAPPESPT